MLRDDNEYLRFFRELIVGGIFCHPSDTLCKSAGQTPGKKNLWAFTGSKIWEVKGHSFIRSGQTMIFRFNALNTLLNRFGYHITRSPDPRYVHVQKRFLESALESFEVLAHVLISKAGLKTFVQVGANDGVHNDGLRPLISRYQMRGVLIEPQPHAANSLRQLYAGNDNIKVVEAAVDAKSGSLELWRVVGLKHLGNHKMDAVTSFDRESLTAQLRSWGSDAEVEPFTVSALPLQEILKREGVENPEIVMIDTEGMDRVVLDQVPFEKSGPALIQFEINNLRSSDLEHCRKRLTAAGYRFVLTERDVICIHPAYVHHLAGEGGAS